MSEALNILMDNVNLTQGLHHIVRPGYKLDESGNAVPISGRKNGRPKGFDGTKSRMPSALAQAFRKAGLDWKEDFALAIKANKRDRIKLWLKLLPYMITTSHKRRVGKWKGKPSKAAMVALEALEGRDD